MAGWLSSRIVVGACWGNPRSEANQWENVTSLAQPPRARCSALQGMRLCCVGVAGAEVDDFFTNMVTDGE